MHFQTDTMPRSMHHRGVLGGVIVTRQPGVEAVVFDYGNRGLVHGFTGNLRRLNLRAVTVARDAAEVELMEQGLKLIAAPRFRRLLACAADGHLVTDPAFARGLRRNITKRRKFIALLLAM